MSEEQVQQDTDGDTGGAQPSDSEVEEIEAERQQRLDPDNRPDNAEIDNSDAELPTVREFAELNADDDETEGSAGSADPSEAFQDIEVSEEEKAEIEQEREQRLDPDNRPENSEVDNTGKTFVDGRLVDDADVDADADGSSSDD